MVNSKMARMDWKINVVIVHGFRTPVGHTLFFFTENFGTTFCSLLFIFVDLC